MVTCYSGDQYHTLKTLVPFSENRGLLIDSVIPLCRRCLISPQMRYLPFPKSRPLHGFGRCLIPDYLSSITRNRQPQQVIKTRFRPFIWCVAKNGRLLSLGFFANPTSSRDAFSLQSIYHILGQQSYYKYNVQLSTLPLPAHALYKVVETCLNYPPHQSETTFRAQLPDDFKLKQPRLSSLRKNGMLKEVVTVFGNARYLSWHPFRQAQIK